MKKLFIELNQTFEIEIYEEEIKAMIEDGVDINNVDDVFQYINAEDTIYDELDLICNAYLWLEDEEE